LKTELKSHNCTSYCVRMTEYGTTDIDLEQLLLIAGSAGAAATAASVKETGELPELDATNVSAADTATVTTGSSVEITVTGRNTSDRSQEYYVGYAIVRPDGTTYNIPSTEVNPDGEEDFQATGGPTSTGCLSPRQGGPTSGDPLFPEPGSYNVIVTVFNEKNFGDGCFGNVLEDRLDIVEIEDAIEVEQGASATVARVNVNNTRVL